MIWCDAMRFDIVLHCVCVSKYMIGVPAISYQPLPLHCTFWAEMTISQIDTPEPPLSSTGDNLKTCLVLHDGVLCGASTVLLLHYLLYTR